MKQAVYDKVLQNLSAVHWTKIAFYLQAEPLMDKRLFERIMQAAKVLKFDYAELSTNCELLTPLIELQLTELVKHVKLDFWLSFQGTAHDKAGFERTTGLDFDTCFNNLKRFMVATDNVDIGRMIMCVGRPDTIDTFWRPLWAELGVKREPRYEVAPPITRAGNVPGVPHAQRTGKRYLNCDRLHDWVHVNWLGQLIPCCMDYNNEIVLGSLLKEPITSIFQRILRVMEAHERPGFLCWRCEKG